MDLVARKSVVVGDICYFIGLLQSLFDLDFNSGFVLNLNLEIEELARL